MTFALQENLQWNLILMILLLVMRPLHQVKFNLSCILVSDRIQVLHNYQHTNKPNY